MPHIRRSLIIADLIDRQTVERNRFQEIVENLTAAVFLVDASGKVLHANKAAERTLAAGRVLSVHNGRLTPFDAALRAALAEALADAEAKPQPVVLTASAGKGLVATILPLASGYRREASGTLQGAAIFVHDPVAPIEVPGETLRQLFDLTGAEVRIVLALAKGSSLHEIAAQFGTSFNTVRTHLHRLYGKTGTKRQADLVQKVLRLMPAVAR